MNIKKAQTIVNNLGLKLDQNGLFPAIIQDASDKKILMLAYMNPETLAISLNEKRTCFWSRSRQEVWRKGETSGHIQKIISITFDCDMDTVVIQVEQFGAACHTGKPTCFNAPVQID